MDIRKEIRRTTTAFDNQPIILTADRRYVRLSDGNGSWWQPVAKLAAVLDGMSDCVRDPLWNADSADVLDEENDYSVWCDLTKTAGIFGGVNVADTMPTPADFIDPDA